MYNPTKIAKNILCYLVKSQVHTTRIINIDILLQRRVVYAIIRYTLMLNDIYFKNQY